jgi:integrase
VPRSDFVTNHHHYKNDNKAGRSSVQSLNFVRVLSKNMPIVTLTDALLQKHPARDGAILRDRILSGLCVRIGRRTKTFFIATSANGKQVRSTLGRWPLLTVDDARSRALPLLRDCRNGRAPVVAPQLTLPTLETSLVSYCEAKKLKAASLRRYQSIVRTHFGKWYEAPVDQLDTPQFSAHCLKFAQNTGKALVDVGRGVFGALFKYLNATFGLALESPFSKFAAAGLMPKRAEPRSRLLTEEALPAWKQAIHGMPEKQRDYLMTVAMTALRRNECSGIRPSHIDLGGLVLTVPETKTGRAHTLPITPIMLDIFRRRLSTVIEDEPIFKGISVEHISEMAERAGAPRFMLHDLRKLVATTGEKLGLSDATNRRILNHAAKRSDTLHRHYVQLTAADIRAPLQSIQARLLELMAVPAENEKGRACSGTAHLHRRVSYLISSRTAMTSARQRTRASL